MVTPPIARVSLRALLTLLLAVFVGLSVSVPAVFGAESPPPSTGPQDLRLGLDRVFAVDNLDLDIDGLDDKRVDVDIAVLDSGIKLDHPDVNIAGRTNCTGATWPSYACTNASSSDGDDNAAGIWHGSNSAVNIAGLDNSIGWVGAAPGARLWSVDILGDDVWNPEAPSTSPINIDLEAMIAGIKWVTAHADEIEVAHLVGGCAPEQVGSSPQPVCSTGPTGNTDLSDDLQDALEESLDAGVVYLVGSGNWNQNTNTLIPQRQIDDLIVVSAMTDTDGIAGWYGPNGCADKQDDSSTGSNWGPLVDVTAPGCAGSEAMPKVTAAAAILASERDMDDREDVQDIGEAIFGDGNCAGTPANVGAANCVWVDTSGDYIKEPLLDLGSQEVFAPQTVAGPVTTTGGWDFDLKTRCVKSQFPSSANYHQDTTQCTSNGKRWTSFVKAENVANPQSGCPGPTNQAFAINTSGSPAIMEWYQYWGSPFGPNWTVNLKLDNVYTDMPCMGADSLTHIGLLDHISLGGGPLPNPRSLRSTHQMAYSDWRPNGGATRLVAGAMFRWANKSRWVEVNLHNAGFPDTHTDPDVLTVDTLPGGIERVVYDGQAIGLAVPNDYTTTTHTIDWKTLVKQASDEGWFTDPLTTNAETQGIHIGTQVKGDALNSLWTTNFQIAGK